MKPRPEINKSGSRATTALSILALEDWAKEAEEYIEGQLGVIAHLQALLDTSFYRGLTSESFEKQVKKALNK